MTTGFINMEVMVTTKYKKEICIMITGLGKTILFNSQCILQHSNAMLLGATFLMENMLSITMNT